VTRRLLLAALAGVLALAPARADEKPGEKVRVLILDGENNHDWRSTTPFLKKALEASGRFAVDVATTPQKPSLPGEPGQATDDALKGYKDALAAYADSYAEYRRARARFHPPLEKYDVVLSNYNGSAWPDAFNKDLEERLRQGKVGLVIVHAANNAFGGWQDYNRMIGMGWRGPKDGARLLLDEKGKQVIQPPGEGQGSGHRYTGPFAVVVRDPDHPVTKGMPREWMHAQDELYDNMRGPIENVRLLATAFSKGTGVHEPMIWTVDYGRGRVFHTPMGHDLNGMRCVGFVATLGRGTEWAATGKVTLPLPQDFPGADKPRSLPAK
jgi:type 1 glutamine amidotransferase